MKKYKAELSAVNNGEVYFSDKTYEAYASTSKAAYNKVKKVALKDEPWLISGIIDIYKCNVETEQYIYIKTYGV